ncbi:MAG TPA: hypothetical protein VHG28_13640 [Longimicrobiaceae bacterium]|nr:hypothetical protein [Longimicrobiaceae bacterium]
MEPTYLYLYEALDTSRPLMWAVTVGVPLLVFATARYIPRGLVLALPAAVVPVVSRLSIVLHPGVTDMLLQEGALDFVLAAWLLAAGTLVGLFAGLWLRLRASGSPVF